MSILQTFLSNPKNSLIKGVNKIHFVGILGVGMSGIAEVMHNQGYHVSGSDIKENTEAKRLRKMGIKVYIGHHKDNIVHAQLLVISSAIAKDNIECTSAKSKGISIVPRAHIVAEMMRWSYGIAVAGSHGKTTTASLLANLFKQSGLNPSYIIGGRFLNTDSNARLGMGEYLIAEADESDNSFQQLLPCVTILTNIDNDHLETFDNSIDSLKQKFVEFVSRLPFYGVVVVCSEDRHLKELVPQFKRRIITYGSSQTDYVQLLEYKQIKEISRVKININKNEYSFDLALPGRHNVMNALAVIAMSSLIDIKWKDILLSMKTFPGIKRRFNVHKPIVMNGFSVQILEDYAHHPTEIEATLSAAHDYFGDKKLIMIFQPHRYSRTKQLFEQFVLALKTPDHTIVTKIYSAGEREDETVSGMTLAEKSGSLYCEKIEDLDSTIKSLDLNDAVLLFLGAGDINQSITLLREQNG